MFFDFPPPAFLPPPPAIVIVVGMIQPAPTPVEGIPIVVRASKDLDDLAYGDWMKPLAYWPAPFECIDLIPRRNGRPTQEANQYG